MQQHFSRQFESSKLVIAAFMSSAFHQLKDKSTIILFTYAPAGLGHLRVTDALYHGLPKDIPTPILLGAQDTSIIAIHRLMSTHFIFRRLSEWAEQGIQEYIASYLYRKFLRSRTKLLYQQMLTLLDQRLDPPSTLLVIATHFGLAHQLAEIKKQLERERKVRILLVVQVTDDTPIHIWYVPGADLTFVPSYKTKERLKQYGEIFDLEPVRIEVIPYPLTPLLNEKLSESDFENRFDQTSSSSKTLIHMAIPISGAAVGTEFFTQMVQQLYKLSQRFIFHIVSREVPFTYKFLKEIKTLPYVKLLSSSSDREVVDMYEKLYQKEVISFEVTKPSEQAFKALYDCTKRGASILLLAEPVGKQEYDNLDFLRRHNLAPSEFAEKKLWAIAENKIPYTDTVKKALLSEAVNWRGISIPKDPQKAAQFIWWCHQQGVFSAMMHCKVKSKDDDPHSHELNSNGVRIFWEKIEKLLQLT